MDLLLTDIRPVTLEPPMSGKPVDAAVPEFAALLRDLPGNAAEASFGGGAEAPEQPLVDGDKALKINGLMADLETSEQPPAAPPVALSAIAALLREPATAATAAPVATMVVAASPQPAQATAVPGRESSQPPAVTGDVLPAGGSGLPPLAVPPSGPEIAAAAPAQAGTGAVPDRVGAATAAAGPLPNADAVARDLAATGSENEQSLREAPGRPVSPLRAEPIAGSLATLQQPTNTARSSSAAGAAAEAVPGAGEMPVTARALQSGTAQAIPPPTGSGLPQDAEPAAISRPREQSDSVSMPRPVAPTGFERSQLQRWAQGGDEVPAAAPRDAAVATVAKAEPLAARAPVTEPAAGFAGERVDPLRNALAVAMPDADAEPQALARDAVFARGSELTPGTSPAQAPVTAPAAVNQAVGGPHAAAQTTVLPPQLEALSIARDAPVTEWGDGIGERVSWLINQKQNAATIRLDPPALGRLEVQIRVADDATTITIQTQHGQTRDLIEAGAPRLREFLQEAGFQNVNVDVSQRQERQQAGPGQQPDFEVAGDGEADGLDADSDWIRGEGRATYRSDNLVDTFA